ncbi:uncharacterized protein G2W53_033704 [Senna tora]|uniref:Uncharacterized protein n=1 Tax=Senna tora TaxID=362788 RepID=A0A834SZR5_9FABA|nr:uncharacterized protein G2W53_033704 [Senna tora]
MASSQKGLGKCIVNIRDRGT